MAGEELEYLHARLHDHFEQLQADRACAPTPAPIFALEHGLTDPELLLLRAHVCEAVRHRRVGRDAWLPFVVYAAEVGYAYSGDEYWQTFEARTPGWSTNGNRQYIRRNFIRFKDTFSGAQPTGAWAVHFSIICWPITHAVLPTDLQRHLARLLFEYRRSLTADVLHDPDELGRRLAARSWQASSRFQNFAQNTELLGRVASALLSGEEEESPYLLRSTLHRIVADLENEREARHWLRDAKSTASQVRTRGFRPGLRLRADEPKSRRTEELAPSTDPEFWLRHDGTAWIAYVDFPDLSVLGERFPAVRDDLNRSRAHIAGSAVSPIASGRLLYGRQRFRLDEWPSRVDALVQLENGSTETNRLLAEQCALPRRGPWLFRLRDTGTATEVRGRFVRPGHEYVLLSHEPLSSQPTWITPTGITTEGVEAYAIRTPSALDADDVAALDAIGIGAVTEVEIRPAGLVPARWDGEGTAEWFVGETPLLALSTSHKVAQSIFSVDSHPRLIPWPGDDGPMFVRIEGLDAGVHDVTVSLIGTGPEEAISEGSFQILIRSPGPRPAGGSIREGLMILPTPVSPTLDELWDGKAEVELIGPADVGVSVDISLFDRFQRPLAQAHATISLPVDRPEWLRFFASRFRSSDSFHRAYDDAEAAEVAVHHSALGRVWLRAERTFTPLRWAASRDKHGPYVRLVDNTEGTLVQVQFYEFTAPDLPRTLDIGDAEFVRVPSGGMVVARGGAHTAAVILPREVHSLADIHFTPKLGDRPRSLPGLLQLLGLARAWASASLTADAIAEWARGEVLAAITTELCSLIGGGRWAAIERRLSAGDVEPDLSRLQAAIGEERYQVKLAAVLAQQVASWAEIAPEERAHAFAGCLGRCVPWMMRAAAADNRRMPEFLLRLASDPASLADWASGEVRANLQQTLDSPVLLRAARFIWFAVEVQPTAPTDAGGRWSWR